MVIFVSVDGEHAHSQCCFTPWGCNVKLLGNFFQTFVFTFSHFGYCVFSKLLTCLTFSIYTVSKSPLFGYHCLFCGLVHSSFSSGSFMLVYQYGNVGYLFDIPEHLNSIEEKLKVLFVAGGRTHSLTCHRHMLQFGTFSQLIMRPLLILGASSLY